MARRLAAALALLLAPGCIEGVGGVPVGLPVSGEVTSVPDAEAASDGVSSMDAAQPPGPEDCTSVPDVEAVAAGICVNLSKVNFGGKKYGELAVVPLEISSCGEAPLELYAIYMEEGSSPDFDVDLAPLDQALNSSAPVVVAPGSSVQLNVLFIPDANNPVDKNGSLVLDTGAVVILSNAEAGEVTVPVSGAAVCCCCPTAIIKCDEGDEVIPQTTLHLRGDQSYYDHGEIVKWEWEVEQPVGSQSVFLPSPSTTNPTFETNVAGVYTFFLTVWDDHKTPSCFPAEYEVVVIPDSAIHVELTWHTPNDPDETNTGPEQGSDLDLHFLHPLASVPDLDGGGAADGWFDIPYDCFWFNAHPNWGSYDPMVQDDPSLDRDDADGAGPENINLAQPEPAVYRVGVHYWDDHGWGASYPTVRVYFFSQLVLKFGDVCLEKGDLWTVCTIDGTSGQVQVLPPETNIVHDYVPPDYVR